MVKLLNCYIAFFLQICNPPGIGNQKPCCPVTNHPLYCYNQQDLVQHLFGDVSLSSKKRVGVRWFATKNPITSHQSPITNHQSPVLFRRWFLWCKEWGFRRGDNGVLLLFFYRYVIPPGLGIKPGFWLFAMCLLIRCLLWLKAARHCGSTASFLL